MHKPLGIDPASGKPSYIWENDSYINIKPQMMRSYLEGIINQKNNFYVIAWDAPLSFSEASYSDRIIDKVTRKWIKSKIEAGLFEKKAINALPFSGLSHWVISCQALGLPFGKPLPSTTIPKQKTYSNSNENLIIEVHPAVSMGLMWLDMEITTPFPIYKKSKEARASIVQKLNFPKICIQSDDILDAYVAHLMSVKFISGEASFLNNPVNGSYVLPLGKSFEELSKLI